MPMDELAPELDPPESHCCTVCGEAARYYFGSPGSPLQTAEGWYCGTHLHEGERLWAVRYGRPAPR